MSEPQPTLHLEHRDDDVAVLCIDDPEDSVNTLKRELAREFEEIFDGLETNLRAKILVVTSGKPASFIVGADLEMLQRAASAAQASALAELSQRIQQRLASLPMPTVAAIHGSCLGGGLELVLALDARVASDDSATRLGFPEVRLGLLPGGGGTQRLPRLIGVGAALELLLSGRELSATQALRRGLVDAVVPEDELLQAAVERGSTMVGLRRRPGRPLLASPVVSPFNRRGLLHSLLARNPFGRQVMFAKARGQTLARTRGNYPAPERILEVVRTGLERGLDAGLRAEARAFGELVVSPQSRELVRIFFATRELKSDTGVDDSGVEPAEVRRIGLLGAGLMGAGIAYVSAARADTDVCIKERDEASLRRGMKRLTQALDERVGRGRMTEVRRQTILERIEGTTDNAELKGCDIVIEAVFEDRDLKRRMLADMQAFGDPDLIFASNTSSIPIAEIAAESARAQNVIGMHYFSPVERMPLLEVIRAEATDPRAVATCVAFGKRQGKTVIVVADGPGFYTTRILAPYLNEAAWLLSDGVSIEALDNALVDFGFPVGPLTLLDDVGIDVAHKVSGILGEAFGPRMPPPPGLQQLVADGRYGNKAGRGFYRQGDRRGGARRADASVYQVLGVELQAKPDSRGIARRCVLQMVNEATRCLDEGILRSARDGDVGAILGLGFPPFLGGPFRYADAVGPASLVAQLEGLAERHGERFAPAAILRTLARSASSFYRDGTPDSATVGLPPGIAD